jgi:NADPH-dependent 2,4-dienoyl-CoA reductase/sulfur reductase-like enzyme
LKQLKIEFIGNSKVAIPSSEAKEGEWDGSFGLQNGLKKISLPDGKTVEADFVFIGMGNKSSADFVEKADSGAVAGGLVRVDEYLKVSDWRKAPFVG